MLQVMSHNQTETRPGRPTRKIARTSARWAERGLAVFGALVLLFWSTLDLSVVVSPSMAPTLQGTDAQNGDRVLTEKVSRWFRKPRRWEVITFLTATGEKRMKRVVGLPGENVQMRESGELLINGAPVQIPSLLEVKYLRFGNLMRSEPVPCGQGYYVLGDFLRDSDDSRFEGPVPADAVLGYAWLIVAPWARFGFVR